MIDIHTHILPGVDDGSRNIEMSLKMAAAAYESGVDTMVCTPHCMPGVYSNYASEKLEKSFIHLKEAVRGTGIPVSLKKGMEVLLTERTEKMLAEKKFWTLNDSHYLLVEFSFDEDPAYCYKALEKVKENGYIPIIAHPCRYYFVQQGPQIVYDWYQKGYGIQINKGSLLGSFGKKEKDCAGRLLRHCLVTCVASDTHRSDKRTPAMDEVKKYLQERYGREYTHMLLSENPERILHDRKLVGYEPVSFIEE